MAKKPDGRSRAWEREAQDLADIVCGEIRFTKFGCTIRVEPILGKFFEKGYTRRDFDGQPEALARRFIFERDIEIRKL